MAPVKFQITGISIFRRLEDVAESIQCHGDDCVSPHRDEWFRGPGQQVLPTNSTILTTLFPMTGSFSAHFEPETFRGEGVFGCWRRELKEAPLAEDTAES